MSSSGFRSVFVPGDYNLAATLTSGQAFRWKFLLGGWEGVIGSRWVRLNPLDGGFQVTTDIEVDSWVWLTGYLQTDADLTSILATFPKEPVLREAMEFCRGLHLLRQDPWECLASFILSSNKQIVQISQIIDQLCLRYGDPISARSSPLVWFSFPSAERLAALEEADLRSCKMGFRAPYLLATARCIAEGLFKPESLFGEEVDLARNQLMQLPGVGRKIADCVLLFAYGFSSVFPVDVWIAKALRDLYFGGQPVNLKTLSQFSAQHFGPHGGYAQQYLFHWMRTRRSLNLPE